MKDCPEFPNQLFDYVAYLSRSKPDDATLVSFLQSDSPGRFTTKHWQLVLSYCLKNVDSFYEIDSLENACLYILKCISDHHEKSLAQLATDGVLSDYTTGETYLSYILPVLTRLEAAVKVVVVLENIDCLSRSTYMQDRGSRFASSYINFTLQKFPVVTFLSTGDSLAATKWIFVEETCKDFRSSLPSSNPTPNMLERLRSSAELQDITVVEIPELTRESLGEFFRPTIIEDKLLDSIWHTFGGNCAFLHRVEQTMRSTTNTQFLNLQGKDRTSDFDEDSIPAHVSKEGREEHRTMEEQKETLRSILSTQFKADSLQFQWKVTQFLALKKLERLRRDLSNPIHFYVTVFESMRYFLSKDFLVVADPLKISHPILQGLLDVKLLYFHRSPMRLTTYDSLTRHFLTSYIDTRYGELGYRDKVEYNMNFLLNQRTIKAEIDRISDRYVDTGKIH